MFALRIPIGRSGRPWWAGRPSPTAVPAPSMPSVGLVLPRLLRRPVRRVARMLNGERQPPRFSASSLSALLLAGFAVYGAHEGGHVPGLVKSAATASGLAIDDVRIKGNVQTSEIDILAALDLDGSTALVGYSAGDARNRVAALPWVESAAVRKAYPATLHVDLTEREPFAIWQSGSRLSLIERNGKVILPLAGPQFAALPLVIGLGAPEKAETILGLVAAYPEIASQVKAYIRVGSRRWDLRLDNGITLKLPDQRVDRALSDLIAIERRERVLSRDIVSIDLRLVDRYVVRLSPEAAIRRAAFVAERGKKRPRAGI